MRNIYTQIIGRGGMARELASYLDSPPKMFEYDELKNLNKSSETVIAIGDPLVRKRLADEYYDCYFISVNKGKCYGKARCGVGTIICPGVIITTNVVLGKHVIININASLSHDVSVGNFVTISPGAVICGNVTIGNLCYIGANATIIQGVRICDNVTIGAGAVVINDIKEPGTYIGVPAKKIR